MWRPFSMLVPLFVLAAGAPRAAVAAGSHPAELGKLVVASAKAEKNLDYAAAISAMKSFQQRGGDPFLYHLRLGWLYFLKREYAGSSAAYRQAVALKPGSINALLGVLDAAEALQDVRQTALAAAAVLRVEPTNYRALMATGGLHFAQMNYRAAAADYSRVLATYPDDPAALSGAAWSSLRLGDHAAAHSAFSQLLGMNPDYPKAREGYELAGREFR